MATLRRWRSVLCALAAAGLLTALAGAGALRTLDLAASDALYQRRSASDGQIVLVGIDQKAIEALGPYDQWGRDVMARLVEALNQSADCRPAVIALDILFTGEREAAADARLAEAAGKYGNVITATAAVFGAAPVPDGTGDQRLNTDAVLGYEEPYAALKEAAGLGHINIMLDTDGILRHHMLYLDLPDGRRVPSLALAVAEKYRAARGGDPVALPETAGRGFWYLPFCGRPGDLNGGISVADVLSGQADPRYFAGKIVLIGPCAPGMQDSYLTAADHAAAMYGLEFQANAVQALLWGTYKQEVPQGPQLAALFLLLLIAWAGFWGRKVPVSAMLWVLLCAGWPALCRFSYDRGTVLHVLWVPAGVTVLFVGCIAGNYIRAAAEKRRITGTFKRYVAPEVVNQLLKQDPAALGLGGKLVDIAVLFVDVRGFTTMSERLPPQQVVEILNRYLTLISGCILRNGGTLDKYIGDAAMAFWGAPLPQEDYVMKAARAAWEMAQGAGELSRELKERYGCTLGFGIGIHTGEAVVGNIGSPRRMDYTAIGDTVNTASRLEANAPAGCIYISRAVADALAGRIQTTSLGSSVKLKGKAEGFEVLTLDGFTGEEDHEKTRGDSVSPDKGSVIVQ